ncbi:urease accessory protein, partial [Tremellales sp. Uapishka_1]
MTSPSPHDHLLYILLDSNLPTGGFVSSSGLESYAKHGFLTPSPSYSSFTSSSASLTPSAPSSSSSQSPTAVARSIVEFSKSEIQNYSRTTLTFVRDAWTLVHDSLQGEGTSAVVDAILQLDEYHESAILSHVARRSSKAQGIAMLTLFGRGLSKPPGFDEIELDEREQRAKALVDQYKRLVRKGVGNGHLAVCFGVMTAAMGLSLVRLNLIGPYSSSQLLLHPFHKIISEELEYQQIITESDRSTNESKEEDFWSWTSEAEKGPSTTWPLGEIMMGRHDLQHSRIFNS